MVGDGATKRPAGVKAAHVRHAIKQLETQNGATIVSTLSDKSDSVAALNVRLAQKATDLLRSSEMMRDARNRQSATQQIAASVLNFLLPRVPGKAVGVDTEHEFCSFWNQSDPNDIGEVHEFTPSQQ